MAQRAPTDQAWRDRWDSSYGRNRWRLRLRLRGSAPGSAMSRSGSGAPGGERAPVHHPHSGQGQRGMAGAGDKGGVKASGVDVGAESRRAGCDVDGAVLGACQSRASDFGLTALFRRANKRGACPRNGPVGCSPLRGETGVLGRYECIRVRARARLRTAMLPSRHLVTAWEPRSPRRSC
jgi:hypothetical protein